MASALHRRYAGLITFCCLVSAYLMLGCAKKSEDTSTRPREDILTDTGPTYTLEDIQQARKVAKARFEEALAAAPKFDRHKKSSQLLLERYRFHLADLPKTYKSRAEIKGLIQKAAKAEADKRYPPSLRLELVEEAKREYPLYKIGDQVSIITKIGGRGIRGRIDELLPNRIKIGSAMMPLTDIITPHPDCFEEESCMRRRDWHVRTKFDIFRNDLIEELQEKQTAKIYRDNAYIHKDDRWVRFDKIIEKEIEPVVDEMQKKYAAQLRRGLKDKIETEMRAEGLLPAADVEKDLKAGTAFE